MWKNLNFSWKVMILVFVLILFTVLTGAGYHKMSNQIKDIGIQSAGDEMLAGYKSELKDMVNVMASTLSAATEGMTDEKEIVSTFSKLARHVRFFPDESGYFFIYKGSVNVLLPIKPELEGKDLIDLTSANGEQPVRSMVEAVKSGGGFFEYLWDKPGKGLQTKLSYAKKIPNTHYSIGTGVYIDNVDEKQQQIFKQMNEYTSSFFVKGLMGLIAIFFLIILPLVIFMVKSITSPLRKLTDVASEYSRGALDSEIEYTDREDEIGALSRAIQRLGKSTKIIMKKLEQSQSND